MVLTDQRCFRFGRLIVGGKTEIPHLVRTQGMHLDRCVAHPLIGSQDSPSVFSDERKPLNIGNLIGPEVVLVPLN